MKPGSISLSAVLLAAVSLLLSSCGGNTGRLLGFYSISGNVSGLAGTGLVLQDNSGNNLPVSSGAGNFAFSTKIASGGNYHVTMLSQPSSPWQTCEVANGSGPVVNAAITNIQVNCTTNAYLISGTISTLSGSGLILEDNGGNDLPLTAGSVGFAFTAKIASGSSYAVTLLSQPSSPSQSCIVTNGSGLVTDTDIANVQLACTTDTYTIGGTILNLAGSGLILQDNTGDNLPISSGATSFTFATKIASGGSYAVSILSQPSGPSQSCAVQNGKGTAMANVTNIVIDCGIGEWAWMAGNNTPNQKGIYGTRGVASPANTPGARNAATSWTDAEGNFWLFGGFAFDANGVQAVINDLWEFSNGQWTWVSGSNAVEQVGVYGSLGVPSPGNVPGARVFALGWTDASGNLWLFGGTGADSAGTTGGQLNDIWRFSGGQWTWMGGSKLANQKGSYGVLGTAAPGNIPGARSQAVGFADASGKFWLFGGFGFDSAGTLHQLNDLWMYSDGQWAWISGSNTVDSPGIYGVKGVAAPGNVPGARATAVGWADLSGNLWLFGGDTTSEMNDLWKFTPGIGQWAWMSGSNIPGQLGSHGVLTVPAASNVPGAKSYATGWADAAGDLWLFGGGGVDGAYNDLWRYSLGTGEWTWMSGSNSPGQASVYGVEGVPAPGNVPGARYVSPSWTDKNGNLWLFGGFTPAVDLNDLWRYDGAALPVGALKWTLNGVTFTDGTTAAGSFVYNADLNIVSNINIVTNLATYTTLANTFPVHPFEFIFVPNVPLTFGSNLPVLGLFPSPGLTNNGGAVQLYGVNGFSFQGAICDNACDAATTGKQVDAGTLVATPVGP